MPKFDFDAAGGNPLNEWYDPYDKTLKPRDYSKPLGNDPNVEANQNRMLMEEQQRMARAQSLLGRQAPRWATNEDAFKFNDAARAQQVDAMGLARQQAMGQGPSAAVIQGQMAQDQAAQQMLKQGMLGNNAAMGVGNQALQQVAGQTGAARGQEINQAQGMYGNVTGALRSQDLGYLNAMNNALYQQKQQGLGQVRQNLGAYKGYEDLAQEMEIARTKQAQDEYKRLLGRNEQREKDIVTGLGTTASTAGTMFALSDETKKCDHRKLGY